MRTPKHASNATEAMILKSVLEYLQARRVLAFRMNSGTAMLPGANHKHRPVRFGVPGMADVLAFPQVLITMNTATGPRKLATPIPLWIECKSPVGVQSEVQKSFQAQVEAEGHRYIIARNVDDVEEALR